MRRGVRRFGHKKGPGADEAFLVGECQTGAVCERAQAGFESGGADDGGHGPVGGAVGGFEQGRSTGGGLDAGAREAGAKIFEAVFVGGDGDLGLERDGVFGELRGVAAASQGDGAVLIGSARDQVDRVLADGTGSTENGDAFHSTPCLSHPRAGVGRSPVFPEAVGFFQSGNVGPQARRSSQSCPSRAVLSAKSGASACGSGASIWLPIQARSAMRRSIMKVSISASSSAGSGRSRR